MASGSLAPPEFSFGSRETAADYVGGIFEREMGVTLHNARVGSPRDDAMRELTKATANLYARRVLRELIQNAFDGAAQSGDARIVVRLDMREGTYGTLYVANSGIGFSKGNVDAISNPALSNKRPGNFIGHKGLGFRSVELLSDDTRVHSVVNEGTKGGVFDGFCFRFATADDERGWLENENAAEFAAAVVGRTHRLQLPVPIETDPPEVARFAGDGFATVVQLPLRDAQAAARAREEIRLLIDERAPIALFLDRLSSLTLETFESDGGTETKTLTRNTSERRACDRGRGLTIERVTVDRRRFLVASMPVDDAAFRDSVDRAVAERHPVERWREWEGSPTVSVAFPLTGAAKGGSFYAFLPMDAEAPFNGCLDAPFFPDADRRNLDLSNPLNSFLLDAIADLCVALAEELAEAGETSHELACAAVDAIAWRRDPNRLLAACVRMGVEIGSLRLPVLRRPDMDARWAKLDEVYDWDDAGCAEISAKWLVRTCAVPLLRSGIGDERCAALHEFVAATPYILTPPAGQWAEWLPALAADLTAKRRISRERWEGFYSDISGMADVLPLLRGRKIFRVGEGQLVEANGGAAAGSRELFISPDVEGSRGRRRRLSGTTRFPPASVAKHMEFADPNLHWSPAVAKAMFDAGLATAYSLPHVASRIGRLLGPRPNKTARLAALRWAFSAWLAHKSPELEAALSASGLQVPVTGGGFKSANAARFGYGWRDTRGELVAELCDAAADASRGARAMRDALLPNWEGWPLRERGTASEWIVFLKILGVRDGLAPVYYGNQAHSVWTWRTMRAGSAGPLAIEGWVGPLWRREVGEVPARGAASFSYQSGDYKTGDTLFAMPLQAEHGLLPPRARLAYARLVALALADLKDRHLATVLTRTSGNSDVVQWPSPLLAFLRQADWVPVGDGENIRWSRPADCWYSSRSDPMPRAVPRIDRSVREILDGSAAVRNVFGRHLSLGNWGDQASAVARLRLLGSLLSNGIPDSEHDGIRSAVREAWRGWNELDPRPSLPPSISLVLQGPGRLVAMSLAKGNEHPTVFVGGGDDPALENLLVSLGHSLMPVPPESSAAVAAALGAAVGGNFTVASAARPIILVDGEPLDARVATERLAGSGREWLAEVAVLALEFNRGFSNRATARTRQQLLEAVRRLRIVIGRRVEVEIEGRAGDLPAELDGVLPVPNAEHPALVVRNASSDIDWAMLARLSRGIATAIERPWLDNDIRVAVLELAGLRLGSDVPQRPSDEAMARAFGQPVERVREIARSLRNVGRRLFEQLVPVVWVRLGETAARGLLDREASLVDDDEVLGALTAAGASPQQALELLARSRDADSLDDLRRELAMDLQEFNAALTGLGSPWMPLSFERRLRDTFIARLDERGVELRQRVRDAHLPDFDAGRPLAGYVEERGLGWVEFNRAWIAERDDLDNATIDAWVDGLVAARYAGAPGADALLGVEQVRQHNRALLIEGAEALRNLVFAWVAKAPGDRTAHAEWRSKAEQVARVAVTSGAFDFRRLEAAGLPSALAIAGLWPTGMAQTTTLAGLGLAPSDLEVQGQAEREAQEAERRRRRTVTVDGIHIDGGVEGAFHQMADVLAFSLSSEGFRQRSGPAELREFPDGDAPRIRRRPGRSVGRDPEYMTDERRTLIGFAGELAAYYYLSRRLRGFSEDHWLSSIGRRYLALPPGADDDGYDFMVPRTRGPLMFEVKAHEGDPGYVELERSQVAAAVAHADGRRGAWSILYVAHATDPSRIVVHELPNPFGSVGLKRFRPSAQQGVRLLLDRADG